MRQTKMPARAMLAAMAVAIVACSAPTVTATPPPDARPVGVTGLSVADAAFLREAHRVHALQESAARLAQERSRDVRVLQLAQRLQQEHAQARARLEALAAGQELSLAARPDPDATQAFGLATLRGAEFDRRYIARAGVAAHRQALRLFGQQADASRSTSLLRFATTELPVLQRHLAAAEALQAQFELRRRNFSGTDSRS